MAACRYDVRQSLGRMKPDGLVAVMMAAWWVLNLLQAAFMGLANDEVYYWYYAKHLDWGYFDHPPLVAVLIYLSQWAPGPLGIRLCSTLLQPCYLYLFWRIIRPADAARRDALTYVLVCFSQPLLQLYGVMALPDAPLMMSTVVFLWAYKRFLKESTVPNALWLGLAVALLGYSKYHGALVVVLVLLSNPRLFRCRQLYFSGAVALLLYVPHLWWQYGHDWVSLRYHLVDRNAWEYRIDYTLTYMVVLLLIFNPLWLWHYVQALRKRGLAPIVPESAFRRSLTVLLVGFVVFFFVATFRGEVQAQWLLPVTLPLVALLFAGGRNSGYVRTVGLVCVCVFLSVRVLAVANPFHFKGEIWQQPQVYSTIAGAVGDRPLQFMHGYTDAAKYTYYTGKPAYSAPYYFTRHSQWQFDTLDHTFAHRETVVGDYGEIHGQSVPLPDGRTFGYVVVPDYMPLREVQMSHEGMLDLELPYLQRAGMDTPADSLAPFTLRLRVVNPYSYDIVSPPGNPLLLRLFFHVRINKALSAVGSLPDTLKAGSSGAVDFTLRFGRDIPDGDHIAGYTFGYGDFPPSDNGAKFRVRVSHEDGKLIIKQIP